MLIAAASEARAIAVASSIRACSSEIVAGSAPAGSRHSSVLSR